MNQISKDKDSLHILQKAGISKTPQRIAVLNTLTKAGAPLSMNGIRRELAAKVKIDRVTLYRILSLFKRRMIIREISAAGCAVHFELATAENPVHPHFLCRNCEKLTCLEPLTFSQANQWLSSDKNYFVEDIEINISGLCANCRNATKLQKKEEEK